MRLDHSFTKLAFIAAAFAGVGACAAATKPPELINAELAYGHAAEGPANEFVPDELHKAKTALDSAETAFNNDPDGQVTRDMGYIAERRAETAEAKGEQQKAAKSKASSDAQYKQTLTDQNVEAKNQVAMTKAQAEEADRQRDAASRRAGTAEQNAATEKAAREDADRRANDAMAALAKIAQLRQDERGLVITLSGDVLFKTDRAELLPGAENRLNQLADTLNQSKGHLTVGGYTDSRGADDHNQDLSIRRATAVRTYLVARGINGDRINATGYGKASPIGDNATAEGRAMNRRVEIVVQGMTAPHASVN